ncbi:MAG: hypothetical protein HOE90_00855 [Bacteriovoracaceae bacterium]|jgi:hypothetical protein|nr:hypothetical protein [Bacteriovoracaceae bacterium]
MAQISLNAKRLQDIFEAETTLNQVLDSVLHRYATDEDVISSVLVDGQNVGDGESSPFWERKLSEFGEIDISFQNKIDLAFDALAACPDYIDTIILRINKLTGHYNKNEIDQANSCFAQVVESLDLFVQLLANVHHTLRTKYNKRLSSNKTFHQLEIHLLAIMKALLPAKEKNDLIMLCDLLEYELVDNLTQWKINAIPELKNAKLD